MAFSLADGAAPRVVELRDIFRAKYALFKDSVDSTAELFGPEWATEFDGMLERLFGPGEALARAAKGYTSFCLDLLRRQRRFDKERCYPSRTYADVANDVYFDDAYMRAEYLPGLLLSHYLWPHHYHQARFFDTAFVAQMQQRDATRFAEVGVGTALYSRRTLEQLPAVEGVGFDISPSSRSFAEAHVGAYQAGDRYVVRLQDVVAQAMEPFDWLICVEVLEHLEDPLEFLRALRRGVAPGGKAFITAALNAPHVDHIYLYVTPEEVVAQLTEAGFTLEQAFVGMAHRPTSPGVPPPSVAAFVVA